MTDLRSPYTLDEEYLNRFWDKVERTEGCWLWTAATNEKGYGVAWDGKSTQKSHRVSYALHHGYMPRLCVLHHCDVPNCVRPDHLFEGTRADNNRDMVSKGRHVPGSTHLDSTLDGEYVRGTNHHNAKINEGIAKEIRDEYETKETSYERIAESRGLGVMTVYKIIKRITWKHVK